MSKTLRQFQCRDDLWARVDALAKRRGISTDDVVQAALLQLFKSKTKKEGESSAMIPAPAGIASTPAAAPARPAAAVPSPAARPAGPPPGLPRPPGPPTPAARPAAAGPAASASPAAAAASASLNGPRTAAMAAPRLPRPASAPAAAAAPVPTLAPAGPPSGMGSAAPKAAPSLPRPQAPTSAAPTRLPPPAAKAAPQQVRPLYVMFENQWYEVDKEEYVIGRGQKFSDLPIKDANISRRHCSIVRRGPDYFIKDLGSTNGIEFEGTRVDNHKIVEGSVYFLCDHQLRFSFTPPSSLG
ncbi:FHA domain-containing protein [Nannocystis sp.]|uniref:FHA domain-containing protein n=1 Tax=Nannocystis sp. TaxID=1962667 RepID=UPI0025D60F18|nr:FHA domain-containing protein [Nannocystis sp.]MBK7824013.1 FHA domain-containing protein [Nannocystis sp.]